MIDINQLRKIINRENVDDQVVLDYINDNYEPPVDDMRGKYNQFLATFNTVMEKNHRYTNSMAKKLKTRLQTYTMEEILEAVKTMANNDFYKGDNDRGWVATPEFILRNNEKIDKFLNANPSKKREFKQPTKLEALEIRLLMQLATGECEGVVANEYKGNMLWMENNNKEVVVIPTARLFTQWLLKNGVKTNEITDIDNLRCYNKYLKTMEKNNLIPRLEIIKLGEQLKEKTLQK